MDKYVRLPLRTEKGRRLYYNQLLINNLKKEIENFLLIENYISSKDCLNILKLNNIENDINKDKSITQTKKQDIINKYKAYEYILKEKEINKDTLKKLYDIRSKNLLDSYSRKNMGKYYRNDRVFILKNNNNLNTLEVLDYRKIDVYVEKLFSYINDEQEQTEIDDFIKSQVIHFYLYYIHPYFDINKRTARVLSIWHLINNNNYKYILFEKSLELNKDNYNKNLYNSRCGNITYFIEFLLKEYQKEIERNSIIHSIQKYQKLSQEEVKIIRYLTAAKTPTLKDITNKYNLYNVVKNPNELALNHIYPLIRKNVLNIIGTTTHKISKQMPNFILALNRQMINLEDENYKTINIKKISK